ncbi:STAS domain-containing protein [Bacillus sp. H-16]|uniref:STAS domain-containing protein n=1 Tax=Alteribacter salitolerans TaxID=2912333 RepID=UPI001963F437|nr:STAS domain-containing protein [Alteribacter salitolerans]MBM7096952.1 STAS domain-containing protein [Alteribacter salitolerans]
MTNQTKAVEVVGSPFNWDHGKGTFTFEGDQAVLFWLNSAFKTFLDTMEEVSGEDAANVVLETTGYRMGIIVGEYFFKTSDRPAEALNALPDIYAAAGWGRFEVTHLNEEAHTAVIRITDSWEYRINKIQGKKQCGRFFPGHFAGLFTGIFDTNVWYEVKSSQIEGDNYCEFSFFPSDITVKENIHELSRRNEQNEIDKLENLVKVRTEELSQTIKDISSPIIPVLDQVVVIPLLGKYDKFRSKELLEKTTEEISRYSVSYLLLDLTGLHEDIDEYGVSMIQQLVSATYLLGIETVLVGISPLLSMKMSNLNYEFTGVKCFSNLQHGITYALRCEGLSIC